MLFNLGLASQPHTLTFCLLCPQGWWTSVKCLATLYYSTGRFGLWCTTSNSIKQPSLRVSKYYSKPPPLPSPRPGDSFPKGSFSSALQKQPSAPPLHETPTNTLRFTPGQMDRKRFFLKHRLNSRGILYYRRDKAATNENITFPGVIQYYQSNFKSRLLMNCQKKKTFERTKTWLKDLIWPKKREEEKKGNNIFPKQQV